MNLNPIGKLDIKKIKRSEFLFDFSQMLQHRNEEFTLEDISESQVSRFMQLMSQQEDISEDSNNNSNILTKLVNKVKQNFSPIKKK